MSAASTTTILINKHQELMTDVDASVSAFFAALDAFGLTSQVTLFTESEFSDLPEPRNFPRAGSACSSAAVASTSLQ